MPFPGKPGSNSVPSGHFTMRESIRHMAINPVLDTALLDVPDNRPGTTHPIYGIDLKNFHKSDAYVIKPMRYYLTGQNSNLAEAIGTP